MAGLDSGLEQHLRHLQLPVVTRTNKEQSIGVGSYASVYEVMVHGTLCAAKEMHPVLVNDTNKRAFLSECVQSSRILHPNVVQFLGIYYPSPRARLPWLVMELMYISLRGLIEKYEKDDFPLHFKLSILMDTCHGLQFLHSQNIIHRDLSSNNILLTKHLVAKISDLGMAKVIPPGLQKHTQAPGTVVFMPPEALSVNPQYGKPIDVFSVGCVCVHVTSMEWPTPLDQVVNNVVLSEVQRRERYFTKMIPSLEQLVKQCLQDKPEQRPVIEEVTRGLKNINYDHRPHEDDNIIDVFTSAFKCSSQDEQMMIIQKDQQLMSKDRQLVEKDEQLSKKDQQLIEKDQQISQKDQKLSQKDQLIYQKDQQLVQKDQQLCQKDQAIYEKDQRIKQKDQEIMEKEKQISQSKSLNKVTAHTTAGDFSKVTVQEEYTVEFPPSWEVMPKDSSGKEIVCHVVDLQPSDPEYEEVYTAFCSTCKVFGRKMTVEKIERIQNPTLYGQYVHRKEIMDRQNPNIQIEKWLFHECCHSSFVKKIYHQGFNKSIAGPNSSSFGGGVGFAVQANRACTASSPAYQGYSSIGASKFMFYVRVLTGDYTEVPKSYNELLKAPPTKDPDKSILYDSVVDSMGSPSQYVVFSNDQSYPDYLITYMFEKRF